MGERQWPQPDWSPDRPNEHNGDGSRYAGKGPGSRPRWLTGRSMARSAPARLCAGLTIIVAVAGCRGSGSSAAVATTTPVPCAASTAQCVPPMTSQTSSDPTTRHHPVGVTVTDQFGFRYKLTAAPLAKQTSEVTYQGITLDADPGEVYVATTVTVGNAMADRLEPDIAYTDNGDAGSFQFGIPRSEAARLKLQNVCDTLYPGSNTPCMLTGITSTGNESPAPTDPISPQLAAGESTQVVIYMGPVPASINTASTVLYFDNGSSGPPKVPTGS